MFSNTTVTVTKCTATLCPVIVVALRYVKCFVIVFEFQLYKPPEFVKIFLCDCERKQIILQNMGDIINVSPNTEI